MTLPASTLFEDSNSYNQEGFGTFDVTIHNGKRYGAGKAYLDNIKNRKNLKMKVNFWQLDRT